MTIKKESLSNLKQLLISLEERLEDYEEIKTIEVQGEPWTDADNNRIICVYRITIKAYPENQHAFSYYITKMIASEEES